MTKILLVSDTHGYIDDKLLEHAQQCDQIWHAGDIGKAGVAEELSLIKPLRAVFGNIDGQDIRARFPRHERFLLDGVDIWMTHIGGYPGRYERYVKPEIYNNPPKLFISGHSHILKIIYDKKLDLLHINPGAYGNSGFHKVRTFVKFNIDKGEFKDMEIVEFERKGR